MSLGRINLITPPDVLFNTNVAYLLVKPSLYIKQEFHKVMSQCDEDINVFVFDDLETDLQWMVGLAQTSDIVIIDVDNCDSYTKLFVSCLLVFPHVYYYTNDNSVPYHILSRNRIFNLDWLLIEKEDEEEDEE